MSARKDSEPLVYVVRIYPCPEEPARLCGLVECVSDGSCHPFTNLEQLAGIFGRLGCSVGAPGKV